MNALESMLIQMAITFTLKQIEEFGVDTDWALVKQDSYTRIKTLVPNAVVDEVLDVSVGAAIDALATACENTSALQNIINLIAAGSLNQAVGLIEDLLAASL